jgi:dimethylargininase
VLVNPTWVAPDVFGSLGWIAVDPTEPSAANALLVGDAVLYPTASARTRERLAGRGIAVVTVDVSELAKAEGAVTCCSLIVE